jgi:hypothetical protein
MWNIGLPAWWLYAPFVLAPLAAWKLIEIVVWATSHVSIH